MLLYSPSIRYRSLRRCFITRAVELGVDFKTIVAWQGHRDGGALIARTYRANFGVLGEPGVNVLELNLALDAAASTAGTATNTVAQAR